LIFLRVGESGASVHCKKIAGVIINHQTIFKERYLEELNNPIKQPNKTTQATKNTQ